jgi:hypothetical protein
VENNLNLFSGGMPPDPLGSLRSIMGEETVFFKHRECFFLLFLKVVAAKGFLETSLQTIWLASLDDERKLVSAKPCHCFLLPF